MKLTTVATRTLALAAAVAAGSIGLGAIPADAATAPTGTVLAASGLSVRKAPTVHSSKVGAYDHGQQVRLYCAVAGGNAGGSRAWYSVNTAGTRWIAASYVQAHGAVEDCPTLDTGTALGVTIARVNLRSGPSTGDAVLDWYPTSSGVTAVCKVRGQDVDGNNRWYLTDDGMWIAARYVRNEAPAPGNNATPVWCR